MRAASLILILAAGAAAAPRPFLETAVGFPEALDIRFGAEYGRCRVALGSGLPVLAWSRFYRADPVVPTAWNPSVTAGWLAGSGHWRLGPEAQALYFYGATDEYLSGKSPVAGNADAGSSWARWRLDRVFLGLSASARWVAESWYAQASLGVAGSKLLPIRTEGSGSVKAFRHPWEYTPVLCLSFGRPF